MYIFLVFVLVPAVISQTTVLPFYRLFSAPISSDNSNRYRDSYNDNESKYNPPPIYSRRQDTRSKYDPPPIYARREIYYDDRSKYNPPSIYSRMRNYYNDESKYDSPPISARTLRNALPNNKNFMKYRRSDTDITNSNTNVNINKNIMDDYDYILGYI